MQKSLSNIDETYIKQLVACIQKGSMKHTEDVLSLFPTIDLQTRTRSLFEISMAKNDEAYQMFDFLVHSNTLPADTRSPLVELLLDKARNDSKFILLFIESADTHQLQEAVSVFANILVTETDPHILHETIKAVGLTGKKSCINVVADFIFYDHAELKQAAVNALGKIGGPSAIKRLAFASSTTKTDPLIEKTLETLQADLSIETQIEETTEQFASKKDTLEGMTDDSDIAQLLKMFNSSSPHDRHTAIDLLIETGAHAVPAVSMAIDTSDSDSIINGLDILGNIRNEIALPHILKILNIHHKDSNVRFAAYEAISKLPPVKSTVSLIEGLEDSSEQVRLAAATAINNNLSEVLVAGLRSKIETSGRQQEPQTGCC